MTDLEFFQKIEDIFADGGIISQFFPEYKKRAGQTALAKKIAESLIYNKHLIAEAGTGIGKSFAYLIVSSLYALEFEKTVLISTNTIPLQTQLIEKDLPIVAKVIESLGYADFRYELAKGRANYLCKRRLDYYLHRSLKQELPFLNIAQEIYTLTKLSETEWQGDKQQYYQPIPNSLWQEINSTIEDCHQRFSPYYDTCYVQAARKRLYQANLIVANHALFFTDLFFKSKNLTGILPNYDLVVFDEAHHIEDVFSRHFAKTISFSDIELLFNQIRTKRYSWMDNVFTNERLIEIEVFAKDILQAFNDLFMKIASWVNEKKGVSLNIEGNNSWLLQKPLILDYNYYNNLKKLISYLQEIKKDIDDEVAEKSMNGLIDKIKEWHEIIEFILEMQGEDDWAHWITMENRNGQISFTEDISLYRLHAQPIHPRPILANELFNKVPTILLSATLAVDGEFSFIAENLGISDYEQFITTSPFPYEENALLVLSEYGPMPDYKNIMEYEQFLVDGFKRIFAITKGRTLVLFTSYNLLTNIANKLKTWLNENNLTLLAQEPDSDREHLIKEFRSNKNSILFGSETFWEGIDIPGDDLKCVVITKLPFPNPSDPLTKARINYIDQTKGNSFQHFMIPYTIIRFKQGFGRLIRTMNDRGVVIIMDSRITRKFYGKKILRSLPNIKIGKIKEMISYL